MNKRRELQAAVEGLLGDRVSDATLDGLLNTVGRVVVADSSDQKSVTQLACLLATVQWKRR